MSCVIEDDKVLTDDIFDKILAWEDDVQSVDVVSMQKVWIISVYKLIILVFSCYLLYINVISKKIVF